MPRANPSYDEDFYLWTQDQAQALRELPKSAVGNRVDLEHVAEEIEDLGKSHLHAVQSLLTQMFVHLLKIACRPDDQSRGHWEAEILAFQKDAFRRYTPGMEQLVDLGEIWRDAVDVTNVYFGRERVRKQAIDLDCPLHLSNVISKSFDLDAAIDKALGTLNDKGPELR